MTNWNYYYDRYDDDDANYFSWKDSFDVYYNYRIKCKKSLC